MFVMSDKMYNAAKRLVQIILPAISALYFGLAQIWGFPDPEKVVGTIAVFTTFLGVSLGISHRTYEAMGGGNVGTVVITEDEDRKLFSLELDGDPDDIQKMQTVSFKVDVQKDVEATKAKRPARKQ